MKRRIISKSVIFLLICIPMTRYLLQRNLDPPAALAVGLVIGFIGFALMNIPIDRAFPDRRSS